MALFNKFAQFSEDRMSAIVLRKCSKCGLAYHKTEGCNRMTCR